jgi:hypothetical protein
MKKIVSIDVGIKNLSFCFFELNELTKEFQIIKWDNIDLTEKETLACAVTPCNKPIKFMKNDECFCLTHSKKQPYIKPPAELKLASLNKSKVPKLIELLDKYKIEYNPAMKKKEIIELFTHFTESKCFESVQTSNATKVNLVVIGRNIQHKFDILFGDHMDTIDTIIIENQIGPLANKMKTIQGMLAQYFIMKNNNIQIEFISASNKLKGLTDETTKLDYKGRKKMGVKCCLEMINESWVPFFQQHKKKDDLADCFLQGVWYMKQ